MFSQRCDACCYEMNKVGGGICTSFSCHQGASSHFKITLPEIKTPGDRKRIPTECSSKGSPHPMSLPSLLTFWLKEEYWNQAPKYIYTYIYAHVHTPLPSTDTTQPHLWPPETPLHPCAAPPNFIPTCLHSHMWLSPLCLCSLTPLPHTINITHTRILHTLYHIHT